jgi:cellobiose phosphorylase
MSESGQAYTWHENAHEFRLTPWHNDPVSDSGGEAFYLRDEQSGQFWSPTPLPARGSGRYVTRHGFGYSVLNTARRHRQRDDHLRRLDAPIKYTCSRCATTAVQRRLSVTGYVEWVLGDLRAKSGMHVTTEADPVSGALFARNNYNTEFSGRVGFFNTDASMRTARRPHRIHRPQRHAGGAGCAAPRCACPATGAGLDACAAIGAVRPAAGQEREIVFVLGVAGPPQCRRQQPGRSTPQADAAHEALAAVHAHWEKTLGAVRIERRSRNWT